MTLAIGWPHHPGEWQPRRAACSSPRTGADETGTGAPDAPFGSLAAALQHTNSLPIYACSGVLSESLTLSSDVTLHGGFDCAGGGWTPTSDGRTLLAPFDGVAVHLAPGAELTATGVHVLGRSDAAVFVSAGASLKLTRSVVEIADQPDAPAPFPMNPDASLNGESGLPGQNSACAAVPGFGNGGNGVQKTCPYDGGIVDVSGGAGGDGSTGQLGGDGAPGMAPPGPKAYGGPGSEYYGDGCKTGGEGYDGYEGGGGLPAAGLGELTATGFLALRRKPGRVIRLHERAAGPDPRRGSDGRRRHSARGLRWRSVA